MKPSEIEDLLSAVLAESRACGAQAADAVFATGTSVSVSCRMGKPEDTERSEGADLGLRIIMGRRQATVSTTDISRSALRGLAARCAAMARAAPEDPYCGLADAGRFAKAPFMDLDLADDTGVSAETLREEASACESAALAVEGVTNSSGAQAGYSRGCKWLMTSNGFSGSVLATSYSISVGVLAENHDGMEQDYDYDSKSHRKDLKDIEKTGRTAGRRAVRKLSPGKISSRTAPVIFENRIAASLLSHLAGAANGAAIARGVSFLKDRRGSALFADTITVTDDPHIPRAPGSRAFDGEGMENSRIDFISKGVLTDWFLNTAQAKQLGLRSNARASRGIGSAPLSGPTNLYMHPGAKSPDDLMGDAGEGILVTDMFSPQVNANSGDYSVGCAGFFFKDGAIIHPVNEITIAGNLLEMYRSLVPASDLEFRDAVNAPSILVPEMTIAGN